jgi:hypothetical protein
MLEGVVGVSLVAAFTWPVLVTVTLKAEAAPGPTLSDLMLEVKYPEQQG